MSAPSPKTRAIVDRLVAHALRGRTPTPRATHPAGKLRRCPKCRSAAIEASVIADVAMRFRQTEGGMWRRVYTGDLSPESRAVECRCEACGHEWRMQKVTDLDDKIRTDELPEVPDAR